MAVGGVLAIVANDVLGLDEKETLSIVGIVVAWVLGDSVRKTI